MSFYPVCVCFVADGWSLLSCSYTWASSSWFCSMFSLRNSATLTAKQRKSRSCNMLRIRWGSSLAWSIADLRTGYASGFSFFSRLTRITFFPLCFSYLWLKFWKYSNCYEILRNLAEMTKWCIVYGVQSSGIHYCYVSPCPWCYMTSCEDMLKAVNRLIQVDYENLLSTTRCKLFQQIVTNKSAKWSQIVTNLILPDLLQPWWNGQFAQ